MIVALQDHAARRWRQQGSSRHDRKEPRMKHGWNTDYSLGRHGPTSAGNPSIRVQSVFHPVLCFMNCQIRRDPFHGLFSCKCSRNQAGPDA
jgi:hypothetical protein